MTLKQLLEVHARCPKTGRVKYSGFFRKSARRALLEVLEASEMAISEASRLLRVSPSAMDGIVRHGKVPTSRTVTRMIAAGLIDWRTAAPSMELARALGPISARRRAQGVRDKDIERVLSAYMAQPACGRSLAQAARDTGLKLRTLNGWLTAGRRGDERYAAFSAAIDSDRQARRAEKATRPFGW